MRPDDDTLRYRRAIDDALDLVARGLLHAVAPRMSRLVGPEWWKQLPSTKDNTAFARLDVSSYARVFEFGPYRTEMRGCFRLDYSSWCELVRRIREHRNELHGHRDRDPTSGEALTVVTDCLMLAERLQLNSAADLRVLVAQVREVSSGKRIVEIDAEDLDAHHETSRRLADEQARAKEFEARAAAASAAAEDALAELQERRGREEQSLRAKDLQIEELQAELREASEGSKAAMQLSSQLEAAQYERADLARDRDQTRAELNAAQREQRRAAEAERIAVDELAQARAEVAALQSELVSARVTRDEIAARRDQESSEQRMLHEVLERLERLERLSSASSAEREALEDEAEDTPLPDPGSPWPYERGAEEWTLSLASHTMSRLGDDMDLADFVGASVAAELIRGFFTIRPRGGRIWVDDDGDACTFVEGELVYLGRLPLDSADPSPREMATPAEFDDDTEEERPIQPGEAWIGPLGTFRARLDFETRDIVTDQREPASLQALTGRTRAHGVLRRLLQGFVQSGREEIETDLRVDRHGRAVSEDGCYLGTIRADEWWQDHIDFGIERVPLSPIGDPLPVIGPPDFQSRTIRALTNHHWGRDPGPMPRGRRFSESGWEFSGYRMVGCPRCQRALAHFEKARTGDTLWHAYYCPSCPEVFGSSELEDSFLIHWPHDYRCEPNARRTRTARVRANSPSRSSAPRRAARDATAPASRGTRADHVGVFDSAADLRSAHPAESTPVGSTATVESIKLGRTFNYSVKENGAGERYWRGVEA